MKWIGIALAAVVVLFVGNACVYSWWINPRTTRELRENPQGERAQKVMLLTLPSGKQIPVNYLRDGGAVYAAADFPWWRELGEEGGPGSVLIRGETLAGHVRAVKDDPALRDSVFARLRPSAPRFLGTLVVIELERASVTGSVTYRERIALPADAVAEITLEDVSLQDVPALEIVRQIFDPAPPIPISFELPYDPAAIDERYSYAVRATITHGKSILFVTDRSYPVLTRGHPTQVELVLARSGGSAAPVADAALTGTRWQLRTLGGTEVRAEAEMPFLQLGEEEDGTRAFGSGGCNRFHGGCTVSGSSLEFGALASTRKACAPPVMELESGFFRALSGTRRYEVRGTWLVLSGAEGEIATFEAGLE